MSKRKLDLAWRFVEMAHIMKGQSCCERGNHACLLVDKSMRIVSVGYNGPAASLPNGCRHKDSPCGCVHAEVNACVQPRQGTPFYAFITAAPCEMCAQVLRNVGVRMVVYDAVTDKGVDGLRVLSECGVGAFQIADLPAGVFGL